jgi:hypothetical protein
MKTPIGLLVSLLLAACLVFLAVGADADAENQCPEALDCTVAGLAVDACFDKAIKGLSQVASNCKEDVTFPSASQCPAGTLTASLSNKADDTTPRLLSGSTCKLAAGKSTVILPLQNADVQKLAIAGGTLYLAIKDASGSSLVSAKAPIPNTKETDGGLQPKGNTDSGGADGSKAAAPIDVPPRNCGSVGQGLSDAAPDTCPGREKNVLEMNGSPNSGKKYIFIDENLSIRDLSPTYVTENDIVILRFVVRKALACRVYAESDSANKYDATVVRIGGQEGLSQITGFGKSTNIGASKGDVRSCGEKLTLWTDDSSNPQQYQAPNDYVTVDFSFGPFTTDEVVFHLYRRDRGLSGNDMEGVIKLVNHKRYAGWFDIVVGGNFLFVPDRSVSAVRETGTELTRLRLSDQQADIDVVVMLKVYALCTDGTLAFHAADVKQSFVCAGLGSGLSLAHPLTTFYPLGLNFTFGGALSLHGALSLNKTTALAAGYSNGDVYSGDPNAIPTTSRLVAGVGVGVGLDPTLFATMLKAVITGK